MKPRWKPPSERTVDGITFDDVFLVPSPSRVLPKDADTSTALAREIRLAVPFVSAPMDRVTEEAMAIAMGLAGGIGILHRGMPREALLRAVALVKRFMAGQITDPVRVTPEMTLEDIRRLGSPYTGFPVTASTERGPQKLLGIITRRDMDGKPSSATVQKLMTPREQLVVAPPDIGFTAAIELMQGQKVEKLPLVDEHDRLVGLVTRRDLNRRTSSPQATTDAEGRLRIGVAVGGADHRKMIDLVHELIEAGTDTIVVDSGHGGSKQIVEATRLLKDRFSKLPVIAGNVADYKSARALIEAGADTLRVGVGPGSICTTRIVTAVGVPQLTAIANCRRAVEDSGKDVAIIADGGISEPGHIVKALAYGASTVMFGNLLARTTEAPGDVITRGGRSYKKYRGMGSEEAMKEYGGERYFQSGEGKLVAEGVSGTVPLQGSVNDVLKDFLGGLKNGMGYVGAATIPDLWTAELVKVSAQGLREARPHHLSTIEGTNPSPSQD